MDSDRRIPPASEIRVDVEDATDDDLEPDDEEASAEELEDDE